MFLEYGITYELNRILRELEEAGSLTPVAELASYQETFRAQFGPDVLANLHGESLLRTMHERATGDSLVHWLEYKNDDTFRASLFGGISGGSAFSFDFFHSPRRGGAWFAGTPGHARQIDLDEAATLAEAQRDELLRAATELERLPVGADEDAYAALQRTLDVVAPRVSDSAWGHKYLSLLYPGKLDAFHNPAYQRFHLIKLLMTPPDAVRPNRYRMAGPFVATAAQLLGGIPIHHLTQALTARHGRRPHTYWQIPTRTAKGGASLWDFMLREACVTIDCEAATNLAGLQMPSGGSKSDSGSARSAFASAFVAATRCSSEEAGQAEALVQRLREGDVVAATDGGHVLGLGYVRGEYYFAEGASHPHRVPVEWRSLDYWAWPSPERSVGGVRALGTRVDNLLEIERHLLADTPPFQSSATMGEPLAVAEDKKRPFYTIVSTTKPTAESASAEPWEAPSLCGVPGRIHEVLQRKGQVILYGPPGTGKSYWAEVAARELAASSWFGRPWSRLSAAQIADITGDGAVGPAVRTCCFHPAYGYEDFLEGYRPDSTAGAGGELRFERRDGIFKRLCADAVARPNRDFFLIIDEINRGDVPRIFGELLSVMEPGRRGKSVLLPLSGEAFHVPSNVYVIATMNTADRSIALLDAALRRRFGFVALGPDLSLFEGVLLDGLPLRGWLASLNRRIAERLERGEGRHLQIGHAYLLDGRGEPVRDLAAFARILRDDIVPLLEEYTADDPALLETLLGGGLYDARRGSIRSELFAPTRVADLVEALRRTIDAADSTDSARDDTEL